MKKAYGISVLVLFFVFMLNGTLRAERRAEPEEREQPPIREVERRETPEQMEMMRIRLAELREAAGNAEQQGRPEEARELRQKAARLAQQLQAQARRAGQRRLREVDEYLERLRQITREAEEMRERMISGIEQPERARPRPEREQTLRLETRRPRVRQRWENVQNVIGQIRDTFMRQLERIEVTFGGLRDNMAQMEREIQELRVENERLRNQLRDRDEPRRPRDRDVPVQRDVERPREGGERQERIPRDGE